MPSSHPLRRPLARRPWRSHWAHHGCRPAPGSPGVAHRRRSLRAGSRWLVVHVV